MNLKVVLRINSGMILALGASLLVPVILSLLYQDGSWPSFLLPAAMMAARGLGPRVIRHPRPSLSRAVVHWSNRDVCLSATLARTLAALLGGVPFLI